MGVSHGLGVHFIGGPSFIHQSVVIKHRFPDHVDLFLLATMHTNKEVMIANDVTRVIRHQDVIRQQALDTSLGASYQSFPELFFLCHPDSGGRSWEWNKLSGPT